jgi:hypothetical protein
MHLLLCVAALSHSGVELGQAGSPAAGVAPHDHLWDIANTSAGDDALPAVNAEMVNELNGAGLSWRAHVPDVVPTRGELRSMCGSPHPTASNPPLIRHPLMRPVSDTFIAAMFRRGVPPSLDARTHWPSCAPVIGHVRNQGAGCGDCVSHDGGMCQFAFVVGCYGTVE